jgi:hypothetical protein
VSQRRRQEKAERARHAEITNFRLHEFRRRRDDPGACRFFHHGEPGVRGRPSGLGTAVTFVNDFHLGQTPVTQDQYVAVMGTNPTGHEKIGDAPVDSVTWDQAKEYCQKLTQLDREEGVLPHDWEYRLPTEAEWEYACRTGSSAPRHGEPQDVA